MAAESFRFEIRSAVESGPGTRRRLGAVLEGLAARRVLLVTDQGVRAAGVAGEVERAFAGDPHGAAIAALVEDVPQDARAGTVQEVAGAFRRAQADAIVAVGGGSVLDTAKAARWALGRGIEDVRAALRGNRGERWPKAGPLPIPLVALPTTAGTGAEVSPVAVVLNEELGIKTNLLSPFIAADVAILDAELTFGLPPRVTAFTGFDALTHAVEAYFSPRATPLSDAYALEALRIIARDLPRVVEDGQDAARRQRMLLGSLMAILAFSQALDAIPAHNLAHAFGGRFGLPHGLCNAVLLPAVMEAMPSFYLGRSAELAAALGLARQDDAQPAFDAVLGFLRRVRADAGLPSDFSEFSLDPAVRGEMPELVRRDPAGVSYELPREVCETVVREVYGPS